MKLCTILLAGALATLAQSQTAQKGQASAQDPNAGLDRLITAGRSSQELARYVFDTHGCNSCHTIGHDGKLGYTEKGKQRAQGFEGCIKMLTRMTVIVQVPEEKRTAEQRQRAARFKEFGCTECHQLAPGKLALTDEGVKLKHLHLGCVDIEKLTSSSQLQN